MAPEHVTNVVEHPIGHRAVGVEDASHCVCTLRTKPCRQLAAVAG